MPCCGIATGLLEWRSLRNSMLRQLFLHMSALRGYRYASGASVRQQPEFWRYANGLVDCMGVMAVCNKLRAVIGKQVFDRNA